MRPLPFLLVTLALLPICLTACGEKELQCGPGTVERGGQCVPVEDTGEGDTDTDTDADSDTDTDTDVGDDADHDGYPATEDCDDSDPAVHPGAQETCNGYDDDCDGLVDDDDSGTAGVSTWYQDADDDGWGDPAATTATCTAPAGFVDRGGDCDDGEAAVNPGAAEVCDGVDNDCDGDVDSADSDVDGETWYADADADGYGDPLGAITDCTQPAGTVTAAMATDCDDTDIDVNPGATEVCDPADTDEDCDGLADDDDPSASGATPWYRDADGDGYGTDTGAVNACDAPSGYVATLGDCDDSDASVWGGGTWYQDLDGDGYGDPAVSSAGCEAPAGSWVLDNTDCNDLNAHLNPGASEICDSIDNDCDGLIDDGDPSLDTSTGTEWCGDADGDGYYADISTTWACTLPSGYVACSTIDDCDDTRAAVNPGASEICGNGLDDDCDGGGYPCELSGTWSQSDADVTFSGGYSGGYAGGSVDLTDVDNDGDTDLLIGSYAYGGTDGIAHLFLGPFAASETTTAADAAYEESGTYANFFGFAATARSDLNGDGYPEVAISDPNYGYSPNGVVYIYRGGPTPSTTYTQVVGGGSSYHCGRSLASGEDLTGDGRDDLVVGCSGGHRVYGYASISSTDAFEAYQLSGDFGYDVAVLDVNGDGTGDLIGTDPDSYAYEAWYLEGPLSGNLRVDTAGDDVGTFSSFANAHAGAIGDVDGDGYEDFAVGDYRYYTYVYLGGTSSPFSAGYQLRISEGIYDADGGDFNGDGTGDLAMCSDGETWIFLGPLPSGTATASSADGHFTDAGYALSTGDVDADGYDDLLIGDAHDSTAGTYNGAAFLFYGGAM